MSESPKGVLAMIIVDGRVGATAVDFDTFTLYGRSQDKIIEAQKKRAMKQVGRKLLEEYGGPIINRLIDDDEATQIAYDIFCGRKKGFEYREELIGYEAQDQ